MELCLRSSAANKAWCSETSSNRSCNIPCDRVLPLLLRRMICILADCNRYTEKLGDGNAGSDQKMNPLWAVDLRARPQIALPRSRALSRVAVTCTSCATWGSCRWRAAPGATECETAADRCWPLANQARGTHERRAYVNGLELG